MAEIREGAANACIPPLRIRLRHPHNELANLHHDPRPSGLFPPLAVVPLPRNQPSVPSQQGFPCDDTGDFCQEFPAKRLTLYREPTSLGVRQAKLLPAKRRCCTARSKSLTSLCRLQSHPAQYVSGIPSAAILLSISLRRGRACCRGGRPRPAKGRAWARPGGRTSTTSRRPIRGRRAGASLACRPGQALTTPPPGGSTIPTRRP